MFDESMQTHLLLVGWYFWCTWHVFHLIGYPLLREVAKVFYQATRA